MKFDVNIEPQQLNDVPELARHAESQGISGIWTTETSHNPFLPLALAGTSTSRIQLGTGIAVAFPRSPMVTAQLAWDLATQSNGRFILGLGTQVKAHITRRFSTDWAAPAPRLKEYIQALRTIWRTFQEGEPLHYSGDHYEFRLMTPFFNPGPIEHPDIPIYIAGVNKVLCRTAGEVADGFHVHPFHTARYLREFILPHISDGAESAGRSLDHIDRYCAVFVVTGHTEEERQKNAVAVKSQIAFYASTPSYRRVMEMHNYGDLADRLYAMSRNGKWSEMWKHISDDMLAEFAVVAYPDDLAQAVRERYDGLLTRVGYYYPYDPTDAALAPLWEGATRVFGQ